MDAFDAGDVIDWKPPQTAEEVREARRAEEAREQDERFVDFIMWLMSEARRNQESPGSARFDPDGYGPRGFLTSVSQAGRVLRYDYDSSGRVKKVTDPFGRYQQYMYDSAGRVVNQALFNGREIRYAYDANSNLTSLTPPGRPAHTFTYSAANLDSVYSPPAAGLPVSATRYTFKMRRRLRGE